jgi:KamA family protein
MLSNHTPHTVRQHATDWDRRYRAYTRTNLTSIPQLQHLDTEQIAIMLAVSAVFPFRTNPYVVEELIDWSNIPHDPIFQLVFPQAGMLTTPDLTRMLALVRAGADPAEIQAAATEIRRQLNPHPAGQLNLNIPRINGQPLKGVQHKYRETVLFFPSQGQTCHAYCTYCFRWAQFIGDPNLKMAANEADLLAAYLREHQEVTNVLITGGDPLIMKTRNLARIIETLLDPALDHVHTIRIGSKALAYWPYRFVSDPDADELLQLIERVRKTGKQVALMAHYSHPRELSTPIAQAAIRRLRDAGAVIRCQAPLIRRINDQAEIWAEMWRTQVALGLVPYYMFVERDTGPKNYFEVPLARAYQVFRNAYSQVSGLARTVRGPSMSATPGKVVVDGVNEINGERVFALHFIQARNPDWVGRPFFARFDPHATWLSDLRPAFGETRFFFEQDAPLHLRSIDLLPNLN